MFKKKQFQLTFSMHKLIENCKLQKKITVSIKIVLVEKMRGIADYEK